MSASEEIDAHLAELKELAREISDDRMLALLQVLEDNIDLFRDN